MKALIGLTRGDAQPVPGDNAMGRCARVGACVMLSLVTVFWGGCGRSRSANPALIQAPNGTDVTRHVVSGTEQLHYVLHEAYPATATLGRIRASLEKSGWKPLGADYLDPDLPSSHSRGWVLFIDGRRGRDEAVEQWMADWQNEEGDVVRYSFEYRWPVGGTERSDRLLVTAIHVPADIVKAQRNELRRRLREPHATPVGWEAQSRVARMAHAAGADPPKSQG